MGWVLVWGVEVERVEVAFDKESRTYDRNDRTM